jgi:hypothetical protein
MCNDRKTVIRAALQGGNKGIFLHVSGHSFALFLSFLWLIDRKIRFGNIYKIWSI